jgi:chemotaxis protein MotA
LARRKDTSLHVHRKLDFSTVGGLFVAAGGILGGLLLEGGRFSDVAQLTAGMIVLGGTLGAVMITTPFTLLFDGVKKLPSLLWDSTLPTEGVIDEILSFATRARRNGIVSLESDVNGIADPFLKKALSLAVDGTDLQDLRRIMELEIHMTEQRGEAEARVFEAAGGYAPTIGIIGAVLGLIQVMKHLEDIEAVGHGIAVAFVATVYGVAVANIVLLPAATKLKLRLQHSVQIKELMLEGVVSIAEGLNPKLVRSKLEAYQRDRSYGESQSEDGRVRSTARPVAAQ